jgi:hypothetical protein
MSIHWHLASTPQWLVARIFVKKKIMKNMQTEIQINAPVQKVWEALTDFSQYEQWNPFIHIAGEACEGSRLTNQMFLEGQKPQIFRPEVLVVKPHREFRWEGNLFVKGLFDGEHYFKLEKVADNKTRLIHGENFRGVLVGLIMRMIGNKTRKGFEQMNLALKNRVESRLGE